jgi:hypothetical protein
VLRHFQQYGRVNGDMIKTHQFWLIEVKLTPKRGKPLVLTWRVFRYAPESRAMARQAKPHLKHNAKGLRGVTCTRGMGCKTLNLGPVDQNTFCH